MRVPSRRPEFDVSRPWDRRFRPGLEMLEDRLAPAIDLAVTKTVDNANPDFNDTVQFTITVNNTLGTENATNVQIRDLLPDGLTFQSQVSISQGTYNAANGTWNVGTVTTATPLTLVIRAQVTGGSVLTNTASVVASDQVDPNLANNSASVTVTVPPADVSLTATVDRPGVFVGGEVTFTFVVRNNGSATATNVRMLNPFPTLDGLRFVRNSTPSQGTFSFSATNRQGIWNVGTLASGASATLEVVAEVTQRGVARNSANVTAAEFDPVLNNNGDTVRARGLLGSAEVSKRSFLASSPTDLPRSNERPVVTSPIADLTLGLNSPPVITQLPAVFSDPDITNTQLRLDTSAGPINIELFDRGAPITVANFLNYVQSGRFIDSIFHRLASNFVLQGGGFRLDTSVPGATSLPEIGTDPAIPNEFSSSRSNTIGTLAMAKVGDNPDSATSQFFINLANNQANLDVQNGGFTVFGRLVSAADQTVVNKLVNPPVAVSNQGGVFNQIPLTGYSGSSFPNDTVRSNFDLITGATITRRSESLTYSVVSVVNDVAGPDVVTATIDANNRLVVAPTGTAGGATVTVRATDSFGAFRDERFHVNVLADNVPTATVALSPVSPTASSTLTATVNTSDLDSDPVTTTFVWKITDANSNQRVITGATTNTLNLTTVAGITGVTPVAGSKITVEVTPNDGTLNGPVATTFVTVV